MMMPEVCSLFAAARSSALHCSAIERIQSTFRANSRLCEYVALFLLYVVLVGVKLIWTHDTPGPVIFGDEYYYKAASEALFFDHNYVYCFVGGKPTAFYPPLYPIALATSFLAGNAWYEWMLVINVVVSSTSIWPLWGIARTMLSRRDSLFCVFIFAAMPLNIVFPQRLYSENLFLPLFLLAFFLLLHSSPVGSRWLPFANGLVWGLCILTRWIFYASLPLFLLLLWLKPWVIDVCRFSELFRMYRLRSAIFSLLGFALVYGSWLVYADSIGMSMASAIGVQVLATASSVAPGHGTVVNSLLPWLVAHGSALSLMAAPYLVFLLAYPFASRHRLDRRAKFFILTWVSLTIFFLTTTTIFVASYFGNNFAAQAGGYYEERYMFYTVPLLPILGFLSLRNLRSSLGKTRRRALVFSTTVSAIVVCVAYNLIISKTLWPDAPATIGGAGFNISFINARDLWLVLLTVLVMQGIIGFMSKRYAAGAMLVGCVIFYSFGNFCLVPAIRAYDRNYAPPRHDRAVAAALTNPSLLLPSSGPMQVFLCPPNTDPYGLRMRFWFIPAESYVIQEYSFDGPPPRSGLLVTTAELANPLITYYQGDGTTYHVYALPVSLKGPLAITALGLVEIRASNLLGPHYVVNSIMWVNGTNFTPFTIVVIDGNELLTNYVNSTYMTLRIPRNYLTAGQFDVYALERLTREKSNHIAFVASDSDIQHIKSRHHCFDAALLVNDVHELNVKYCLCIPRLVPHGSKIPKRSLGLFGISH